MTANKHRVPHVMKPLKSISVPTSLLFVDTETKTIEIRGDRPVARQVLSFGIANHFRLEGKLRTRETILRFDKASQFWDYVESKISKDRPLYIFAHNAAFDMTILNIWDTIEDRSYEIGYAVLEATPFILQLNIGGGRVMIIDTYNYWKQSLADMGKSIGYDKLPMPSKDATRIQWDEYCKRDVEVLREMVVGLLDYLRDNELGSFGVSAASMAFSVFKTSFLDTEIMLHDRNKTLLLERSCYSGGLVNNWVVGKVNAKKVYHLDVNSLYPSCMIGSLPCKFIGDYTNISPAEYTNKLKGKLGCAWVLAEDYKGVWPKRHGHRLCEVSGRMELYLCGEELQRALTAKIVKHVVYASVYDTAPVFRSYVEHFWQERVRHKKAGNVVGNTLAKLLMNSLYGRFAMRGRTFVKWDSEVLVNAYLDEGKTCPIAYLRKGFVPPVSAVSGKWRPLGLSHSLNLRYIKGELEVELTTGEHAQSFVAIAACITSAARQRLRDLIAIAGKDNVYYCDTDSIFCNEIGYRKLVSAKEVDAETLGKLKLEATADTAIFYGPKDYTFGDKVTLKGIKKNAKKLAEKTFEQDQFEGIKSILSRGGAAYVDVRRLEKTLSRKYNKGNVSPLGKVTPFVLSDW